MLRIYFVFLFFLLSVNWVRKGLVFKFCYVLKFVKGSILKLEF